MIFDDAVADGQEKGHTTVDDEAQPPRDGPRPRDRLTAAEPLDVSALLEKSGVLLVEAEPVDDAIDCGGAAFGGRIRIRGLAVEVEARAAGGEPQPARKSAIAGPSSAGRATAIETA